MVPNVELHITLTRQQRAEIQQEVASIRRARLLHANRSTAPQLRGLSLSPVRLWTVLTHALTPGAALPPVA